MVEPVLLTGLACAVGSTLCFLLNLRGFRRACDVTQDQETRPAVSVLIPARDEGSRIRETVSAVLASVGVDVEVLVLDDQSRDETATIMEELAAEDKRVRLLRGSQLPAGWCGKQFACHQLAQSASHNERVFIDADVTLVPDAIARCVRHRQETGVALLSGFPRQRVGTLGEALLVPLMYIVMLTYLPFLLMRRTSMTAASAGCGQLFATTRQAYATMGGHAAIKTSLHDGVMLPRAYRRAGLRTDVFDARDIASCRMYHGWQETLNGLLKNAHEGIAHPRLILPFTLLMTTGYVAPTLLAVREVFMPFSATSLSVAFGAMLISLMPRFVTAIRFDRAWLAVCLFPISVLIFLALQWTALVKHLLGARPKWRGRSYSPSLARGT